LRLRRQESKRPNKLPPMKVNKLRRRKIKIYSKSRSNGLKKKAKRTLSSEIKSIYFEKF